MWHCQHQFVVHFDLRPLPNWPSPTCHRSGFNMFKLVVAVLCSSCCSLLLMLLLVVVVIRLSGWIAAHSSSVVLILRPWWWLPSARSWWQWSRNDNTWTGVWMWVDGQRLPHHNYKLRAEPTHVRTTAVFFVGFSGFLAWEFPSKWLQPPYQQELIPQDLANTVVTPVKGASCLVSCLLSMIFTYCATCP